MSADELRAAINSATGATESTSAALARVTKERDEALAEVRILENSEALAIVALQLDLARVRAELEQLRTAWECPAGSSCWALDAHPTTEPEKPHA